MFCVRRWWNEVRITKNVSQSLAELQFWQTLSNP